MNVARSMAIQRGAQKRREGHLYEVFLVLAKTRLI